MVRTGELHAPPREFGPGATTVEFDLVFTVGMLARPVTNAHALVYWFVDDGEHAGFLDLPITVTLTLQTRTFDQPVVTPPGTALGGNAELILANDGNCRFRGHMKATGLPSYKFRVRAVLRSSNGLLTVAAQKTGEAKGLLDPGPSQFDWDEPIFSQLVADRWADVQSASMVASKSYGMSGILGTLGDLLVDWWEYLAANIVIGPVAGVIFLGSELGVLTGSQWAGPGGLVGLGVAGGVAFLTGPTMIIPAMIGGTLVGSQFVKRRAMTTAEKDFAALVFGDTLPTDRIVLTNLIGLGGAPFTIPGVDGSILLNMGDAGYDSPMAQPLFPANGYTVGGQVFIHELTHAWQIAHWPLTIGYFWEAALDHMDLPNAARYGPAGPPWSSFGEEEQAKIVDHWFAGVTFYAKRPPPTRLPRDPNDPYFTYIANNIRMGQP